MTERPGDWSVEDAEAQQEREARAAQPAEGLDEDGYTLRDRAAHVIAAWDTDRNMLDEAVHRLRKAIDA
jgi:hypothetical protein